MPSKYVCPICDSSKIGREEAEKEYYCDDCCSFFEEPKLITTDKEKGEDSKMGNRYKSDLDVERIKALSVDKTVPEIAAETGYKITSIRSVLGRLGLKAKVTHTRNARKSSKKVVIPKVKADRPVNLQLLQPGISLKDITLLDIAIEERNKCQERVFTLNKVIEILQ